MSSGPSIFKKTDVARACRAVIAAGLPVSGVEIEPDGKIRILAVPPGQAPPSKIDRAINEWDADYGKPAA